MSLFVALHFTTLLACQETQTPAPIRSLQQSGELSLVCRGPDGRGRELSRCPDYENSDTPTLRNRLLALLTQNATGEVATVDLSAGLVVDVDPATPGLNFLRIGARPVDIATTPGGEATFVGVAELGKEGIFALPTSCLGAPTVDDEGNLAPARDLTLWSACSLPVAPGKMEILIDRPNEAGEVRPACSVEPSLEQPEPLAASRSQCPVDLTQEQGPAGRRKLAVALPDYGELWVLDAQSLLDRPEGEYSPCQPEAVHAFDTSVPETVDPVLPDDLIPEAGCVPSVAAYPERSEMPSRPSGMSLVSNALYVGDQGVPQIHVLDVKDPCQPSEKAPLLPTSVREPSRVVTTTELSASPLTTRGQRFLYAIDELDQPASVMMFDISPESEQRTPLVREGSPLIPFEPPDRLAFAAAAEDITFALRDLPEQNADGTAVIGTYCDPDPSLDSDEPAARYRPNSNRRGASPVNLRGIFSFILLSTGRVATIDVEDFDAPCRRPVHANPTATPDFRGCVGDPSDIESFSDAGRATVTDEVSCRVVQPHRPRSSGFARTSSTTGVRAPSLRSFPRLTLQGRGLPSGQSEEGKLNPKLLAVEFPDPQSGSAPAQVYVGTTLYESDPRDSSEVPDNRLVIDPAEAELPSLSLPYIEPRAYPPRETVTVTYEGALDGELEAGSLEVEKGAIALADPDQSALYCKQGVLDKRLAAQYGQEEFGLDSEAAERFAERHADFVEITSNVPAEEDRYWKTEAGASCGGAGFTFCDRLFGAEGAGRLPESRDLSVVSAYQDRLELSPRVLADGRVVTPELFDCCFPGGIRYVLRASRQWVVRGTASGFRHTVVADPETLACEFDCSPEKRFFKSRVFEVTLSSCNDDAEQPDCSVAVATADDLVCVVDEEAVPLRPDGPGSECIFDTPTARFAIYRGLDPQGSRRDMTFSYDTDGGFATLTLSLHSQAGVHVLPGSIADIPALRQLAIVDPLDQGLTLFSLDTLGFVQPSPYF